MDWFKKSLTRTSRETETSSEHDSLLSHRQRRDINSSMDTISNAQSLQTRQEERKPNLWTGEGMQSQKLEVETKGLWQRIRGTDTRSAYVNRLTEDFDQRHRVLVTWAYKEEWDEKHDDLLKRVLDCNRREFKEDLQQLWTLKKGSSSNALERGIGEGPKARAVEFLKAVSDVLQDLDWRLRHAGSLENKGRLSQEQLEEAFDALDTNNVKYYLTVRNEVRQSIRSIDNLYEAAEGNYTRGKRENIITSLKKEYNEGTKKFMKYFSERTREDESDEDLSTEDIDTWKKAGRGLASAERLIREHGVAKFSSYGHDNHRNGLEDTTEE